jgi:hypothetical protein
MNVPTLQPKLSFAFAFSQRTTPSCIGTRVWLHSSLPEDRLPQTKKKKMFFFGVSDILWIIYFFLKIVFLTQTLHQPTQPTQKTPPKHIITLNGREWLRYYPEFPIIGKYSARTIRTYGKYTRLLITRSPRATGEGDFGLAHATLASAMVTHE